MFDFFCIIIAAILTLYSRSEYRVIAYLVLIEFAAHKIAYVLGIQLTDLLNPSGIYLAYIAIEVLIIVALVKYQSHLAIIALIFINLTYNMLTVSQYVMTTFDFYGSYELIIKSIMVMELMYLSWITAYVANFRRKYGFINTSYIDRLFRVRGRSNNGLYSSRPKR